MVGVEFIQYLKDLNVVEYAGVEDFTDKLSFLYTVIVLMLSTLIISTKQYFSSSISCYIPTVPSGSDFEKYLENYCWVHGTIPLLDKENIPQNHSSWATADEKYRINYYQWVPFMLGLQTMLFYTPRLIWQLICHNRTGTDIENLINVAVKADKKCGNDRKSDVEHVATSLELMLFQHREVRTNKRAGMQRKVQKKVGFCVPSKRLGTWLICSYLFIKILYLANAVGQVFLMQKFLGFDDSFASFGIRVAQEISNGQDWKTSRIFPRISYCYVENIRQLGASNQYISQCVLPINMLNEKLYIFLWFWTTLVAIFTGISIPIWTYRLAQSKSRVGFIKKFIWLKKDLRDENETTINHFIHKFLRHDGVFLLRMISMNAGDVIASDIIYFLYEIHNEKYLDIDFCDAIKKISDKKPLSGQGQTPMKNGGYATQGSSV